MKVVLRSTSLLFFIVGVLLDLPVAKVRPASEAQTQPPSRPNPATAESPKSE